MIIYGITLWEPWASAMRAGLKTVETRSWPVPSDHAINSDALLLIHAAQKWDATTKMHATNLVHHDVLPEGFPVFPGCAVALTKLNTCASTTSKFVESLLANECPTSGCPSTERSLGDYSPGRFAWHCKNPVPIDPPIEMPGKRKLWKVDDEHVDKIIESVGLCAIDALLNGSC